MKKIFFLSVFITLISFLSNSCASKRVSKKIIVASSGKIESLDPARANTLKAIQLILLHLANLFHLSISQNLHYSPHEL